MKTLFIYIYIYKIFVTIDQFEVRIIADVNAAYAIISLLS